MKRSAYPELRNIAWRDLVPLSRREAWIENTIALPWLAASLLLAGYGKYALAIPCSFMFFLTGLRLVHNGFHQSLGLSRTFTRITLHIYSLLLLSSMHAVRYNHLQHHKHCMGELDYEGKAARMPGWKAFLYGPLHIFHLHRIALIKGKTSLRRKVIAEICGIFLLIGLTAYFSPQILTYHLIVMALGECCSAFFAVWTVHHHCDEAMYARTQRSIWKNFLSYNMFFHLEHHLFPAVPTLKLPELARRIDEAIPELPTKKVF